MRHGNFKKLPWSDPISGEGLYVSELTNDSGDVVIRGKFEIPAVARLTPEQVQFMETFLRCRGMYNQVEAELGISYPTVKSRLEALLKALDLEPIKESPKKERRDDRAKEILDQLERGELSAEEAKAKMKELKF
ncbi:MAG: DUF2089 domain-containing protein [Armatimonadetes bacterium]|jgi:hypothetical protein|nr:DUF2089 domain-containing protein [Armatimonadota bacterium]